MRVLVALDYGECSALACEWVLSRVEGLGVEALLFLHVRDGGPGSLGDIERATRELRRFVDALTEEPVAESVEVRYSVVQGKPADEILKAAASHKVDAVVMGTNGRTGLDRLLVGSVAEAVVRGAPCTVVVVKPTPT